MMDTIEIKADKSWKREVIEYFEDLGIICNDYNRTVLRYLGKLKASAALNDVRKSIVDIK
jgi:hypothetical protein